VPGFSTTQHGGAHLNHCHSPHACPCSPETAGVEVKYRAIAGPGAGRWFPARRTRQFHDTRDGAN
jgi:hypothetical protein